VVSKTYGKQAFGKHHLLRIRQIERGQVAGREAGKMAGHDPWGRHVCVRSGPQTQTRKNADSMPSDHCQRQALVQPLLFSGATSHVNK